MPLNLVPDYEKFLTSRCDADPRLAYVFAIMKKDKYNLNPLADSFFNHLATEYTYTFLNFPTLVRNISYLA